MTSKKSFWAQISGLEEEILFKQSEEVELRILTAEKKFDSKAKERKKSTKAKTSLVEAMDEKWLVEETHGQLSLDLYEQGENYIIESTIAGVKADDIDITVEQDLITIRGQRKKEESIPAKNYFYQECFWGKFSRTLVLPGPVRPNEVKAEIKNGVLRIILPKSSEAATSLKPR